MQSHRGGRRGGGDFGYHTNSYHIYSSQSLSRILDHLYDLYRLSACHDMVTKESKSIALNAHLHVLKNHVTLANLQMNSPIG